MRFINFNPLKELIKYDNVVVLKIAYWRIEFNSHKFKLTLTEALLLLFNQYVYIVLNITNISKLYISINNFISFRGKSLKIFYAVL